MAGVSAAYHLAPHGSVALIEAEVQLAKHTTGRSAAVFTENYGGPVNERLTTASRSFMESQAEGLADSPILSPLGMLEVYGPESADRLVASPGHSRSDSVVIEIVDQSEIRQLVPCIRPGVAVGGVWEPNAAEIDVMGLHQAFLRGARRYNTSVELGAGATAITKSGSHWDVQTGSSTVTASIVVNAAGAWGDVVASAAGVKPVGLMPTRRTAFTVPTALETEGWPFVTFQDGDEHFYFKTESGGQLLCSPSDETPSEPCDARPEEIDIAKAIDSINERTSLSIRSVRSAWAGLRTFAPDRDPVIGEAEEQEGFFWFVGQGGTGIQTAPAAGALLASLIVDSPLPDHLARTGLNPSDVAVRYPSASP